MELVLFAFFAGFFVAGGIDAIWYGVALIAGLHIPTEAQMNGVLFVVPPILTASALALLVVLTATS